jgi:hypothetical protein
MPKLLCIGRPVAHVFGVSRKLRSAFRLSIQAPPDRQQLVCPGRAAAATSRSRSCDAPPLTNVENQIADKLDPIGFVIRDFNACDFLDQYYQFKTIKPVSAQIAAKISIIRDTPYIDTQMFGDESAHSLDIDADPVCSPCCLILTNAANCHDQPPIRSELWHGQPQASPNALLGYLL